MDWTSEIWTYSTRYFWFVDFMIFNPLCVCVFFWWSCESNYCFSLYRCHRAIVGRSRPNISSCMPSFSNLLQVQSCQGDFFWDVLFIQYGNITSIRAFTLNALVHQAVHQISHFSLQNQAIHQSVCCRSCIFIRIFIYCSTLLSLPLSLC